MIEGSSMDDPRDHFPIGMRVLAIDDDPTCLMVLETLLRRCQYHVTVTKHATTALKLLKENKNKFDLIISDVVMPGMDGFELLVELVGLEMDLPVIMLSANDDPKMVMKGITHGACDYLLKPIRIEELKNIWQHVLRRRNKTSNQEMTNSGSSNAIESLATGNSDQNGKSTKKRKDHVEDDDEDHENSHDDVDPSNHKKSRVVWSVELHRKFVAAVNQLGVEKAVPKKILEMMNVEKLTRENVASHLQKYRLYLKRISCVPNQQADMMAALGSAESSYLRMGSLSGFGPFQTSSSAGQFHNNAFRSFPTSGISILNTPTGLNVHHAQNLNNSTNDQLKFQSVIGRGYRSGVQKLNTLIDGKQTFPISSKLPDQIPKVTMGGSSFPVLGISNNALMLEANPQDTQRVGLYENSKSVASQHSKFSFSLVDNGRSNDIWSTAVLTSKRNSYLPSECFRQAAMPSPDNFSVPLHGGILSGASSTYQFPDSLTDMHSQGVFSANTSRQVTSNVPFQCWDDHNQDPLYHSNVTGSSISSVIPVNGAVDPEGHTSTNSTFNKSMDFRCCDPLQMKHAGIMEFNEENSLKPHQVYTMNQQKSQNSCIDNNLGSLEDLVIEMMNEKDDEVKLLDGDFFCNNDYSGGTCM